MFVSSQASSFLEIRWEVQPLSPLPAHYDSEKHNFCLVIIRKERAVVNFTETHVRNQFCRALGLQPPNAE